MERSKHVWFQNGFKLFFLIFDVTNQLDVSIVASDVVCIILYFVMQKNF